MPFVSVHKARPKGRVAPKRPADAPYQIADKWFNQLNRRSFADLNSIVEGGDLQRMAAAMRNKDAALAIRQLPEYGRGTPEGRNAFRELEADLKDTYRAVITESGKKALRTLDVNVRFDLTNTASIQWIDAQAVALTRRVADGAARNVLAVIRSGFTENLTVDEMASAIKPMIGLHPNQLDAVVRRFATTVEGGTDPVRAAGQAARYAGDLLSQRAESIARTETIAAEAQGTVAGWNEAVSVGLLDPDTEQEWISGTEADGVCSICEPLDKVRVPLGQPWQTKIGPVYHPPAHTRCRCAMGLSL